MDRIQRIFADCRAENRKALIVFASCGCPDPEASEALIGRYIESGADIVELGVPFSDPMADGAVIQAASQRALAAGTTFRTVIGMLGRLRRKYPEAGFIVFSYFNILFHHGLAEAARELKAAGADGILAVDLPYEERDELKVHCDREQLHLIPLLSPATSVERARKIVAEATGFVYYVTVRGVTGERAALPPELAERLEELRRFCPAPVAAGFGIATPEAAGMAGAHADGVIVGSALVKLAMEGSVEESAALVRALAHGLKY